MWVCGHEIWNPPGAGITCNCELLTMGAGNETWSFARAKYMLLTTELSLQPPNIKDLNPNTSEFNCV